jgi:anaerobic dimethyl sulfoxide reductase subunit C (anchor subunit)
MPYLHSPEWPLLIDLYFFLVGLAGGAFMAAGVAEIFGSDRDRVVTRIGTYVALLALIPGPLFLIVDLGVPSRFLHMLMVPKGSTEIGMGAITIGPFHVKPYSPMNLGAWALLGFGACAAVVAVTLFLEDRRGVGTLAGVRKVVGTIGLLFAFFVAAYPGQLLAATAQPFWTSARPLGALFLAVGASSGMATVALILSLQGPAVSGSLAKVRRAYTVAVVLQALALIGVLTAVAGGPAWSAARVRMLTSGSHAMLFWAGAVVVGLLAPLALELRDGFFQGYRRGRGQVALASALILIGGFLTKLLIFAVGQA